MAQTPRSFGFRRALDRLKNQSLFAFLAVFLTQLKVIWLVWQARDLSGGDTLSYFNMAKLWHDKGKLVFAWSPLYTTFYGAMLNFSSDVATVTMAHRIVIVLVLPLMLLAVARRLLSPLAAWAVAVWWCILPVNFNALYEVHLFAVIPILAAYIAVARIPGAWGRGTGLALLVISTVLMRNEMLAATALFAVGCMVYEARSRTGEVTRSSGRRILPYAVPCAAAFSVCAALYMRAIDQAPALWQSLAGKHTLNICQVYAFGYQQRHPEWSLSPWLDCQKLMQTTFGAPEPSLLEAAMRNPKVIAEHVAWNFSLAPAGLQDLLFSCISGHISPDYLQVRRAPWIAGTLSLIVIAAILAGGRLLWLRRKEIYAASEEPVRWAWFAMSAVAAVSIFIIATQRPRPAYLFPLGILLMIFIARCIEELIGATNLEAMQTALPVVAIAVLVLVPSPYTWFLSAPRPMLSMYRLMRPFGGRMRAGQVLVAPYPGDGLRYVFCDYDAPCKAVDYTTTRSRDDGEPLTQYLAENGAGLFIVDEQMSRDPQVADFLNHASALGWNTLVREEEPDGQRVVLEKASGR